MKMNPILKCNACGSREIAVEAIVIQGDDGALDVVSACDKGHSCNACGSEDIGEIEVTRICPDGPEFGGGHD